MLLAKLLPELTPNCAIVNSQAREDLFRRKARLGLHTAVAALAGLHRNYFPLTISACFTAANWVRIT